MKLRIRPLLAGALVVAVTAGAVVFQAGAKSARSTTSSTQAEPASPGTDRNGFLGVNLQDLTRDLRDSYDYDGSGALVSSVVRGGPADDAGVEEGDIITKFNDLSVNSAEQLTSRIRSMDPGALASIWVWRDGKEVYLGRAELVARNDRDDDDWAPAPRVYRTPRTPRAPAAPRAPRAPREWNWNWHDDDGNTHGTRVMTIGRGRLGVETRDLDDELGSYFGSTDGKGVLVLRVVEDTPAEKAGLKVGDVILAVGGTDVADTDALRRALRGRDAGSVELKIRRKGTVRTVTAQLADRDEGWHDGWMGWVDDDDDGEGLIRLRGLEGLRSLQGLRRLQGLQGLHYDLEDLDPEDRARLRKDLDQLREDLKDLRGEIRNDRDDDRD